MPINNDGFCTVMARASDNSSFNIFLHGGMPTKGEGNAWSDVYVLSLPSFVWAKVQTTGTTVARGGHTCHLIQNKMMIIGGRGTDQADPAWGGYDKGICDINPLVNIFDINNFEWDTGYDSKDGQSFLVNKSIYRVIGGE